eukprot:12428919-Karenia_brevis.AAC.1
MTLKNAVLAHDCQDTRKKGMAEIKELWGAVLEAEEIVKQKTHPKWPHIRATLKLMAWSRSLWNREDRVEFRRQEWSCNDYIVSMIFRRWKKVRHTKTVMEDLFPGRTHYSYS